MVLWSLSSPFDRWDPLEVWRIWADDVRGGPIAAGHFLPEEAPEETIERLLDFLDQDLQKGWRSDVRLIEVPSPPAATSWPRP
jgi:hypothetical protein